MKSGYTHLLVSGHYGPGIEVGFAPGRVTASTSLRLFGGYRTATTCGQIDSKEQLVAIPFSQHFPFNKHDFFAKWATVYCQALK